MDEAERRFQECLDRFSRELGDLVMRQVEEQVQAALSGEELSGEELSGDRAEPSVEPSEQLELRLEDLRPEKKTPTVPRVNPNSMLGAELSQVAGMQAAIGTLSGDRSPEPAVEPPAPTAPQRPLFVHRRARDGRIHELSRASELPASG